MEEKTRWIGVIRRPKVDIPAFNRTGVKEKYRNDYVSHFYTKEEDDYIAHSTGKKGLFYEEKYDNYKNLTKYFLRVGLHKNRKSS